MGKYVIKCNGKYVSMPGSKHSYTTSIKNARKYSSREEALHDKCDNESVTSVEEEVG